MYLNLKYFCVYFCSRLSALFVFSRTGYYSYVMLIYQVVRSFLLTSNVLFCGMFECNDVNRAYSAKLVDNNAL